MKHFLLIAWAVLCLASCGERGSYTEHEGTICYTYWTFSFGRVYDALPQVDPLTFESVNDWLGRDAAHVYFKNELVAGADPATVKAEHYPLFFDNNHYYYKAKTMQVADMKSFEVLKRFEDHIWAKDNRYAYFDTLRIDSVDIKTFRVKSHFAATDKRHVYFFGEILPLADPDTYEPNWKGVYSRDKSHIWFFDELLEDADYATFDVDKEGNGFDKYGHFRHGQRE